MPMISYTLNIKTIIVRYETHANYNVYMLFDEIIWENNWLLLITGDYGKLTHCMIILLRPRGNFLAMH